jgi:hypothetical protein
MKRKGIIESELNRKIRIMNDASNIRYYNDKGGMHHYKYIE